MTRKTQLSIATVIELLLGTYCVLACIAWCAKLFLPSPEKSTFSPMIAVWLVLAAIFFSMYIVTLRWKKALDAEAGQSKARQRTARTRPAAAPGKAPPEDSLKQGIRS